MTQTSTDATWCALLDFVLDRETEEPMAFLRAWREGDFDVCRKEWPEAPEAVYPDLTSTTSASDPHNTSALADSEQRAILRDPVAIGRLIDHHDAEEAAADAYAPGWGEWHTLRTQALLALGRQIIAEDPELWTDQDKRPFGPRHAERMAEQKAKLVRESTAAGWKSLPYATADELSNAFKAGTKFVLHYHDTTYPVTHMKAIPNVVLVQPPGMAVKVRPDGLGGEGTPAIWLEQVASPMPGLGVTDL